MKLERWALLAEIVSGIAIVVTLGVLIYETRQNTAATYAASYDQLSADLANWRLTGATIPSSIDDLAYFMSHEGPRGAVLEADTPTTYVRGQQLAVALFQIFERAYFARRDGRLGDDEWNRFFKNMCSGVGPAVWPKLGENFFSDAFVQYMAECSPEP